MSSYGSFFFLIIKNGEFLNLTSFKGEFLEKMHALRNLVAVKSLVHGSLPDWALSSIYPPCPFCHGTLPSALVISTDWIPQLTLASYVSVPAMSLSHAHFA